MKFSAVAWYQKKIGTYDKQQWEKTVEQRILNDAFAHIPLKNAKLKTEQQLIDVDLVRGSSFPKAKPKQSLITVLRLAILRFVFLPVYAKWWVAQTSPTVFGFLFVLYALQMFTWGAYSYNVNKLGADVEHIVSMSEMLVPMSLGLILSVTHSQIVATASSTTASDKQKQRLARPKQTKRDRVRRKRKIIKTVPTEKLKRPSSLSQKKCETVRNCGASGDLSRFHATPAPSGKQALDTKLDTSTNKTTTGLRKRKVNWDSPIKHQVLLSNFDHCVYKMEESNSMPVAPMPLDENTMTTNKCEVHEFLSGLLELVHNNEISTDGNRRAHIAEPTGDDDGFESLNGKSSSGEENTISVDVVSDVEMHQIPPPAPFRNVAASVDGNTAKVVMSDSDTDTLKGAGIFLLTRHSANTHGTTKSAFKSGKAAQSTVSSESECDFGRAKKATILKVLSPSATPIIAQKSLDSSDTDEEGEDCETVSSQTAGAGHLYPEVAAASTEWIGITTNSDECSYSSEINHSDSQNEFSENGYEYDVTPACILNPSCGVNDRISCTIWDHCEAKKAEMSVLDISSAIIERVEAMAETCDYVYIGLTLSVILSFIPAFCRLCEATVDSANVTEVNFLDMPVLLLEKASFSCIAILRFAFGESTWEKTVLLSSLVQRVSMTFLFFFLLAVAERTFKQRFLYAKLFSHLTSSRRARKSELPHFRLNKVRNIKTWLSVRSYLKRRGPQRSVDVIVSAAFLLTLLLLGFLSVEWLKDSPHIHSQYNLEALVWSCALGTFLLRFMTLGTKINRKYRSISVLITEQINLYLQIEQKPHKKEELMVSNSVLKLAADLLKELESPFKISGLSANPYLYTTVKVVILSALSGVLSEMLGFKLKLHKIKIK